MCLGKTINLVGFSYGSENKEDKHIITASFGVIIVMANIVVQHL